MLQLGEQEVFLSKDIDTGSTNEDWHERLNIPEYELQEEELRKFVDLSIPNALATSKSLESKKNPANEARYMPLYKAQDIVIFVDPVTNLHAYGKILCDWDFRHGESAPTIIRGDNSLVWYVVELQGYMKDVSHISSIIPVRIPTPPPNEFPKLIGIQDSNMRDEYQLAKEVMSKLMFAKATQDFGSNKHFNSISSLSNSNEQHIDLINSKNPLEKVSKFATKRGFTDAIRINTYSDFNEENLVKKYLSVIAISEDKLIKVKDYQESLDMQKNNRIQDIIKKRLTILHSINIMFAWNLWVYKDINIKAFLHNKAALRIQTSIRRWFCRDIINNARLKKKSELYSKWKSVHDKFNIIRNIKNKSNEFFTIDQKIYFKTKKDADIYFRVLHLHLTKIISHLNRLRQILLQNAILTWKQFIKLTIEASMKIGHWEVDIRNNALIENQTNILSRYDIEIQSELLLQKINGSIDDERKIIRGLQGQGISNVDTDYNTLTSLPLALNRQSKQSSVNVSSQMNSPNTRCVELPPTNPSIDIQLPPLPIIPATQGSDGSPLVSNEMRAKYISYRVSMNGPTDNSCWIIPGFLMMGGAPYGLGQRIKRKNHSSELILKDSPSLLMLSGIGSFVSLLTLHEEMKLEKQYQCVSLETSLQTQAVTARKMLREAIFKYKRQRDTEQTKLDAMFKLDEMNTDNTSHYKEQLRRRTKIGMYNDLYEKTTIHLSKFPESLNWKRFSIEPDTTITKHEILPIIWYIEDMLAKGECVYVYSMDGLDRASLICGCVIGRLYNLTHTDVLFRLQVHANSFVNQISAEVPINSPQSQSHRILIEQVLKDSNRVYEAINLRSQVNPETFIIKKEITTRPVIISKKSAKFVKSRTSEVEPIIEEYRIHNSMYETHSISDEAIQVIPNRTGRGIEHDVNYQGNPLIEDFSILSEKLLERPGQTSKPTFPLLRREKK